MSSLLESFRDLFPAGARREGDEYAREGRVRDVAVDRSTVRGTVGEREGERVEIGFGPGSEGLDCSCAGFEADGPCGHLWALLRVIDQDARPAEGVREGNEPRGAGALGRDVGHAIGVAWRDRLEKLRHAGGHRTVGPSRARRAHEIRYAIDAEASQGDAGLVFRSVLVRRRPDGSWGEPETWVPWVRGSQRQMNSEDHAIFTLIRGTEEALARRGGLGTVLQDLAPESGGVFRLGAELTAVLAPRLASTGRLHVAQPDGSLGVPLVEDLGEPWRLRLAVTRDEHEAVLSGEFERPAAGLGAAPSDAAQDRPVARELMSADLPLAVVAGGYVVLADRIARFEGRADSTVLRELRLAGELRAPADHEGMLIESLLADPAIEPDAVEGISVRADVAPTPHLFVESPAGGRGGARRPGATRLDCHVSFHYGGATVDADSAERGVVLAGRVPVLRDLDSEQTHLDRLFELGVSPAEPGDEPACHGTVTAGRLRDLVPELLAEGWSVEAEGRRWRPAVHTWASVSSGIDWFEVQGSAQYGDEKVSLPRLLAAARRGDRSIRLGDGSVGVLPEKWLARWNLLDLGAKVEGEALRLRPSQGMLLDALLAEREDVDVDDRFLAARQRWSEFRELRPRQEPDSFCTELRPYQREGLGWLNALRELGLGGCLADDMGLGKTVQVLALFEQLRRARAQDPRSAHAPSLVVAPRSLVFNWIAEARRFAPELTMVDYTGPGRRALVPEFDTCDVVITTYGTLRRDAEALSKRHFDVCVLDEAQAIKNASSQVAKAARLIQANQRLALSGTPIENNLGELWSLMEYLEPGLLGRSHVFRDFLKKSRAGVDEDLTLLSRSIAPFFLRRTKEAVCDDLPEKSELDVSCRLGTAARKEYDELRAHYRQSLLSRADESGIDRIRMHVLEGLLRLRQAACHPGLIDENRRAEDSAKLEVLLPMLDELVAEGHKALVFSQFTSFLSIVRERLEKRGTPYAYLDGQTRHRAETVRRFQEDDDCPLFLVSLKAGGSGLNLTAADYVFLLDPWWNPATEAQAVDRAHRIGRTRPVIAYRLITADTVEERVRELQEKKRGLADALFGGKDGGAGSLSNLTREDLELLFG